jgi:CheY-like chemotaxis protein
MSVTCAASAEEASEVVEAAPPHVILLDVAMPGMSGPELVAKLTGAGYDGAIIFLTARARPSEIAKLAALNAQGIITKPFEPLMLAKIVRQMIRTKNGPAAIC